MISITHIYTVHNADTISLVLKNYLNSKLTWSKKETNVFPPKRYIKSLPSRANFNIYLEFQW